jgi:hypothetical protein
MQIANVMKNLSGGAPFWQHLRHIELTSVTLGDLDEPVPMGHRDRPAIPQEDAELPEILDCTTRVDRRKALRIRQVYLGHRDGAATDADGFEPNGLLA